MPKTVFIYCLKDPITGDVRYIGKTDRPKKRFLAHVNTSAKKKNHLGNWLRSLKGEKPILVVLHEVSVSESWQEEERRYISCARAIGMDLANATDGGEGAPGWKPSTETLAALSAAHMGVPLSPEHRAALSAAWTPERRAVISSATSAALTGVPKSREHRSAISAALTGVPKSNECRAAMSAARSGVPRGPYRKKGARL